MLYLMRLTPEFTEYNHGKVFVEAREDLNVNCCKIDTQISRLTTECDFVCKSNKVCRLPLSNCKRKRQR